MAGSIIESVRKFVELHRWFCVHSREYVGILEFPANPRPLKFTINGYRLHDWLYWPVAWMKFMWLSRGEWL